RAGCIDDEGWIARGKLTHLPLKPFQSERIGTGHKLLEASEFLVPIMENCGVIDHDEPFKCGQASRAAQDFVEIFLVSGNEESSSAVAHLKLELRCGSCRIDAVNDAAQRLGGKVADQPLFAGVSHYGHAVAAREPQIGKGARRARHQFGVTAPAALAVKAEML